MGLGARDIQALRAVTREEYVSRQVEGFIVRYKVQAVAGLGLVDGPAARTALEAIANDPKSPLSSDARAALRQMK